MTRWSHVALVLASLSAFALSGVAAAAAPGALAPAAPEAKDAGPITTEDIKAAYEKADYPETLRLLGRVLALKGRAAEPYDRYELLMLRAESHLKVKAQSAALAALEEAEKVATEDKAKADAKALAILVKRSKNLQYTPKVMAGVAAPAKGAAGDAKSGDAGKGARGPFDITDLKQREAALAALYAEEKALVRPKVKEADRAKTLVPVEKALQAVVPLRELELAATGSESETGEAMRDLADAAHKLMAKSLDDMTRRTARIADRANQIITYTVMRRDGSQDSRTSRQGLAQGDGEELKAFVEDCKRIVAYSRALAAQFPDGAEPFEDLEEQARDVGERAHEVRTDNYSNIR